MKQYFTVFNGYYLAKYRYTKAETKFREENDNLLGKGKLIGAAI